MNKDRQILIYDGECKLCQHAVTFLRSKNSASGFEFLQAKDSRSDHLLQEYKIAKETMTHTVVLIDKNKVYTKSEAVIRALQKRGGIWRCSGMLMIIPSFVRNMIYDWVAGIRKKL